MHWSSKGPRYAGYPDMVKPMYRVKWELDPRDRHKMQVEVPGIVTGTQVKSQCFSEQR